MSWIPATRTASFAAWAGKFIIVYLHWAAGTLLIDMRLFAQPHALRQRCNGDLMRYAKGLVDLNGRR